MQSKSVYKRHLIYGILLQQPAETKTPSSGCYEHYKKSLKWMEKRRSRVLLHRPIDPCPCDANHKPIHCFWEQEFGVAWILLQTDKRWPCYFVGFHSSSYTENASWSNKVLNFWKTLYKSIGMTGRETTLLPGFIYFKCMVSLLPIFLHWNISPMRAGA